MEVLGGGAVSYERGTPVAVGEVESVIRGVPVPRLHHPGVELRANLKSIAHRCHVFEAAFVWELSKETIHLPLGCLQGGH